MNERDSKEFISSQRDIIIGKSNFPISREISLESRTIETQYQDVVGVLTRTGVLRTLNSGDLGIIGIDGQEYPIPSLDTIQAVVMEKWDVLKKKQEQGFTRLLVVPFGMSAKVLGEIYLDNILSKWDQRDLFRFSKEGNVLDFSESAPPESRFIRVTPVTRFTNPSDLDSSWQHRLIGSRKVLRYHPKNFEAEDYGVRGTKEDILDESSQTTAPGWRVLFIEDLPILPDSSEVRTIEGRKQLGILKIEELSSSLKGNSEYHGETGLTPEDWFTYALLFLDKRGILIDSLTDNRDKVGLIGSAWYDGYEEHVPAVENLMRDKGYFTQCLVIEPSRYVNRIRTAVKVI